LALSHKESSNGHFKSGNLDQAARSYRRGVNALKSLNSNNGGDEQVKAILVALQTNLSTVTHKQGKYRVSRDVALKALGIDPNCIKVLYRCAMAHRMLGDVDSARDDLRSVLGIEPNNAAARKELASAKRAIDERRMKEKAGLQKAFSSSRNGGSSLYSDKEEEERRREEERREKDRLEKEATEVRKKEWENECVERMAR
jgi:tetratricopeptide (TPR) repeat protein